MEYRLSPLHASGWDEAAYTVLTLNSSWLMSSWRRLTWSRHCASASELRPGETSSEVSGMGPLGQEPL